MGRHCFLKLETFFFHVGINSLIIITTFSAESVSYPDWRYEACRPKNCGTGPNINYPFYVANYETDFCGYPGFKVSCEAKKPVYRTSRSDYFIEDIFYQNNSFRLVNVEYPITCASNATHNSFAYLDTGTDQFPCELSVHAPVEIEGGQQNQVVETMDYAELLRTGFTLEWVGISCAAECENSGGHCGFNNSSSVCFCPDRPYGKPCNNDDNQHGCPQSFNCGKLGPIKFPFSNNTYPGCGLCTVNCSEPVPIIYLWWKDERYEVKEFLNDEDVNVSDKYLRKLLSSNSCDIFSNFLFLYRTPSISYTISTNLTLFKCPTYGNSKPQLQTEVYNFSNCPGYTVYYTDPNQHTPTPANLPSDCEVIHLPILPSIQNRNVSDLFSLLAYEFTIGLHVTKECYECRHNGGQCHGHREFHCIKAEVIPGVILLHGLLILAIRYRKKLSYVSSVVLSINTSSDPSTKPDLEGGSVYFGVPVFSYTELEEATNNFDPSKELGDGGFGTVYYGKLQDGREVAVKRLYEHNYKRVTQFMNEIEILTRLRHRNLVTLYGCTSHRAELLLVSRVHS
ncbi:LEAF RUST 10 DISEASE-RESISTANCE LOCUS RECEPTOR-LIKE PROTEIN KINASE-like 1.1 [Camellia lanceoleosa]|uniref:LEAF RUST 10 DISEASE-RESISTANCE LOCUS RECEPTOR-LIKE PROTEIN KINASE-like 1.1 n=1 Tax=Camellia lanceoleosa TaxID=1840588 RepID=A0ACC0I8W0_9ERIC|nr:LEAF RUST 10 DISEASE-RESISTANCE LOCUS RECEPTOR-LIKE PROTEIN KINASE-like 1.1 [Camellia lanceoleosa]